VDPASTSVRDILGFVRRGAALFAENVDLALVAARFGTPLYVYSRAALAASAKELLDAPPEEAPHRIFYAVKANGTLALLELVRDLGCDFEVGSKGELARVLAVGVAPSRILYSGVGKRDDEIDAALGANVRYLSVESESELVAIARLAATRGQRAAISLRVNPEVDAATHPHIMTALAGSKFGVRLSELLPLAERALALPSIALCGLTCHVGSQIVSLEPFRAAAAEVTRLAHELVARGAPLTFVGVGGGLGVRYAEETPPSRADFIAAVRAALAPSHLDVVFEPGRALIAEAGVLVTRVVRVKSGLGRRLAIVDAGMNDLIRPALYGAYHHIEPVRQSDAAPAPTEVVGPVCESADTFGEPRLLPQLAEGDLLAIHTAGAYGFAMGSNYNGRPRPAEVLVDGDRVLLIRERERVTDLWRGERLLDGSRAPSVLAGLLDPADDGRKGEPP